MKPAKPSTLEQMQEDIKPSLIEALNNSSSIKEILEQYGVLEAIEIQLKLNVTKLETQEVELRDSKQSQLRVAITRLNVQIFEAACTSWCTTCEAWRPCGDCPVNPSQC